MIHVDSLSKDSFCELFTRIMSESLTLFGQELYKQRGRVAMGSPVEPTLTNAFLCYHEIIYLQICSSELKPVMYRRYIDDTFLPFCPKHHIEKLKKYLNRRHGNINFTSKTESKNFASFLDIKRSKFKNKFTASVYHKPTFSEVFQSFISKLYNTTYCLPFYKQHSTFGQALNFLIRRLITYKLF